MKALMYHYVQPSPEGMPHFRYLHVDDFRRQMNFVAANFTVPERDELLDAVRRGHVRDDWAVLTFDDGFSDHYKFATPILLEYGFWGIFYITGSVYHDRRMLDVHRLHVIAGQHGGKAALAALTSILEPHMLDSEYRTEFHTKPYLGRDDDADLVRFKRIMNYFVTDAWRDHLMDRLMAHFYGDGEPDLVSRWYIPADGLREMQDAGMIIGSHGMSHRVFSRLSVDEQEAEIRDSFDILENYTGGLAVRTFCYPYGGDHTFTADTERLLTDHGCLFSFSLDPRDVTDADIAARPQALPRFDCNRFPHGRARKGNQEMPPT